jgi:hypothetical protein
VIRLEPLAAGAHDVVVSFWDLSVVFFEKFSGHPASPLLDLWGRVLSYRRNSMKSQLRMVFMLDAASLPLDFIGHRTA